jgi:hypothetical protein
MILRCGRRQPNPHDLVEAIVASKRPPDHGLMALRPRAGRIGRWAVCKTTRAERKTSVRAERIFGYIGLGFFFLFPLVSLLQLRDTDEAWRQAASRVRPSVLSLHAALQPASDPTPDAIACGVVVDSDPVRLAIAGRPPAARLASPTPGGWVQWQTAYEDPQGDFTILQSAREQTAISASTGQGATPESGTLQPAAARVADTDSRAGIPAALVAPAHLQSIPIWVGMLTPQDDATGRRTYLTELLRPVQDTEPLASAHAESQPELDPALRGAPFVSRDGSVVALYLGRQEARCQAVPIAPVRDALQMLERRAAR